MDNHAVVNFQPSGRRVMVPVGSLLTGALVAAGIFLPLDCGGNGTCGRCRVIVKGETSDPTAAETNMLGASELEEGWRLACQTRVLGDLQVMVPTSAETAEGTWRIDRGDVSEIAQGMPVISSVNCQVPEPSLEDPRSDLRRVLEVAAGPQRNGLLHADYVTAGWLSRQARATGWRLNTFLRDGELVGAGDPVQGPLGLAVDLGSTKIAAYLVELAGGEVVAAKGRMNPQVMFGADIVTRLQRAVHVPEDGLHLTTMVRDAIDGLAGELAHSAGAKRSQIAEMSLVGNSVMIHLLLGLPLEQMGAPPFVAVLDQAIELKARELGIRLAPGAYVYIPPLVGGYVGSDNVAMIIGAELDRPGGCRLGLDIGTNTEVVLTVPGNAQTLFICSAPSGPTFEGAHLSCGMRAMSGSVSEVRIEGGEIIWRTIDGTAPAGICGSGIIDAIAELLREGMISRQGHLKRSWPEVRHIGGTIDYVLVPADRSATGREIVITQSDISQVQLAKAAISAAGGTLLDLAGLKTGDISEVILAGSFGGHIDVENARRIGLVPDIPGAVYRQVGNAAGKGARQVLNCREARKRAVAIPGLSRYVELSSQAVFNRLFARSLAFPDPTTAEIHQKEFLRHPRNKTAIRC